MDPSSSLDDDKRIIRRVYEEFTNQRQLDPAGELFSRDFVDHGSPPARSGVDGLKETMRSSLAAGRALPLGVQAMFAAELCADCLASGQWAEAIAFARPACAYTGHDVMPVGHMLWPETIALVKAGDLELAISGVDRYGHGLAKYDRYRVYHLRAQAVLAKAQGDTGQAHARLREAVALAESIGRPGDLWQLYAALGDVQKAARITRELAANLRDEQQRENFLADTEKRLAPVAEAERQT